MNRLRFVIGFQQTLLNCLLFVDFGVALDYMYPIDCLSTYICLTVHRHISEYSNRCFLGRQRAFGSRCVFLWNNVDIKQTLLNCLLFVDFGLTLDNMYPIDCCLSFGICLTDEQSFMVGLE
jgi:glycopeptide antibiotics resistance protein